MSLSLVAILKLREIFIKLTFQLLVSSLSYAFLLLNLAIKQCKLLFNNGFHLPFCFNSRLHC